MNHRSAKRSQELNTQYRWQLAPSQAASFIHSFIPVPFSFTILASHWKSWLTTGTESWVKKEKETKKFPRGLFKFRSNGTQVLLFLPSSLSKYVSNIWVSCARDVLFVFFAQLYCKWDLYLNTSSSINKKILKYTFSDIAWERSRIPVFFFYTSTHFPFQKVTEIIGSSPPKSPICWCTQMSYEYVVYWTLFYDISLR